MGAPFCSPRRCTGGIGSVAASRLARPTTRSTIRLLVRVDARMSGAFRLSSPKYFSVRTTRRGERRQWRRGCFGTIGEWVQQKRARYRCSLAPPFGLSLVTASAANGPHGPLQATRDARESGRDECQFYFVRKSRAHSTSPVQGQGCIALLVLVAEHLMEHAHESLHVLERSRAARRGSAG